MKKIFVLVLSLAMMWSLAACGGGNSDSASVSTSTETLVTAAPDTLPETDSAAFQDELEESMEIEAETTAELTEAPTEAESGKTLVVYFSATGSTEKVADYIIAATRADVLELEPVNAYTDDDLNYRDDNSRVVYEHDNPEARTVELVASTVENWEAYDTVFIGYPIWWGIAAWPVNSFVEANDFTGKTVIPFCTSTSSDLGESGELLKEAAGTGDWLEGARFPSSASEADVLSWISSLGY